MERITHTLNHAQARELFDENAVYFYGSDAVPYQTVATLFGEGIAAASMRYGVTEAKDVWQYIRMAGGGGKSKLGKCFPIHGFLFAVSEHNRSIIGEVSE